MTTHTLTPSPASKKLISVRSLRKRFAVWNVGKWLVAILWFLVTVFPVWWMFNVVFTDPGSPIAINPRLYPSSLTAGINNISTILSESQFLSSYVVSLSFALLQVGGMLLICSMAAFEFGLFKFPGKNILFFIALSALMVPFVVTLIPTYRIVANLKWLNSIQGLAVPGMASAFGLFLLRQFMENLPHELMDAAEIDGAGHFGTYWFVALPLSYNGLITLGVLGFMFAWGSFIWPLVVNSKAQWYTVSLAVSKYLSTQSWSPPEVTMTASFLAALPPVIFYVALQRFIVQGIALTGLKG
ncbi:MAG TPA: carbohydrate ABC transporter permease [Anaerolineae bacterium]